MQTRSEKGIIDNDGTTCDTVLVKNEYEDEELLTDENDVTIQHSSSHGEIPSNYYTPVSIRLTNLPRNQSNSEEYVLKNLTLNHFSDSKSLR